MMVMKRVFCAVIVVQHPKHDRYAQIEHTHDGR